MDGIVEIKKHIVALIKQAAERAQQEGKLPQVTLPEIGDHASSSSLAFGAKIGAATA